MPLLLLTYIMQITINIHLLFKSTLINAVIHILPCFPTQRVRKSKHKKNKKVKYMVEN